MPYLLLGILFIIIFIITIAVSDEIFGSIVASIIISFIIVFIFSMIFSMNNKREVEVVNKIYESSYKLDALNDNFGTSGTINGSYFLGTGSTHGEFGQQISYVFYFTKSDGEIIMKQYKPSEIKVYQNNSSEGYYKVKVQHIVREIDPPWRHWIFHNKRTEITRVISRELHIPKGTILRNLKLDLQ